MLIEANTEFCQRRLDQMIEDIDKFLKLSTVSPATLEIYGHYLVLFALWINDREIAPENVEPLTVIEFLKDFPQWSYSTKHNITTALHQFYRWKYGDDHPVLKTHVRKEEAPPQRSLSSDELRVLLSSIETDTPVGVRDKAIVCLMADTGMRATEVCNLEIKNLHLDKLELLTCTKGGHWLQKVYTPYTRDTLQAWLSTKPQVSRDHKFVFISVGGKRSGTQLTRHGLHALFERLSTRARMESFSPHALRRTFATLAIENGAPTRLVQVAGGWSTLQMVERYTKNLRPEAFGKYSPLRLYNETDQKKNGNGKKPKKQVGAK
jgi:integrase/recombinase XerD